MGNVIKVDFSQMRINKSNKEKRDLFERWLDAGLVNIFIDVDKPGVKVPEQFSERRELSLNFSYDFQIEDFAFNEKEIWGTLEFASGDFFCRIPWDSIYFLRSTVLEKVASWDIWDSSE